MVARPAERADASAAGEQPAGEPPALAQVSPVSTPSAPAPPVQVAPAGKPGTGTAEKTPPRAAPATGATRAGQESAIPHIPANARFIRIGRFEQGAALDDLLRRLNGLRLPIVRERPDPAREVATVVIMVGPFDSRQAIVMAFDRLQRAGFRNLAPQ